MRQLLIICIINFCFFPLAAAGPPEYTELNNSGEFFFQKISYFDDGFCTGQLGALKFLIDCETMRPVSKGFHEIKIETKGKVTMYIGTLGAGEYIIKSKIHKKRIQTKFLIPLAILIIFFMCVSTLIVKKKLNKQK